VAVPVSYLGCGSLCWRSASAWSWRSSRFVSDASARFWRLVAAIAAISAARMMTPPLTAMETIATVLSDRIVP
jgi:hypothetical protein